MLLPQIAVKLPLAAHRRTAMVDEPQHLHPVLIGTVNLKEEDISSLMHACRSSAHTGTMHIGTRSSAMFIMIYLSCSLPLLVA